MYTHYVYVRMACLGIPRAPVAQALPAARAALAQALSNQTQRKSATSS